MKSRLPLVGACAALATAGLQAEVKITDYLSLDGYATGAGVVTEGTSESNGEFFNSGRVYDSIMVGANGTYKDFTTRVSLLSVIDSADADKFDSGLLDAYVTYKKGNIAVTGGKYLGWLGFESFHSPNNAFISYSLATYASPYSTGGKIEYLGEGFSTGISVRDTQVGPGGNFFDGDGEFADDIGYEAYAMLTSVENLTVFAGLGYEDIDDFNVGGVYTYDLWASYASTETFSLAAEISAVEDITDLSWLVQGTYAVTKDLSVSARVTGFEDDTGGLLGDVLGYGLASTYVITPNFSIKGEVTETDLDAGSDVFSYARRLLPRGAPVSVGAPRVPRPSLSPRPASHSCPVFRLHLICSRNSAKPSSPAPLPSALLPPPPVSKLRIR
jgi:Putative beta-barrel porin-2, OmpL-like. bbp2